MANGSIKFRFEIPLPRKFKTKSSSFKTKAQVSEWARKMELEKSYSNTSMKDVSLYDYYVKWYENVANMIKNYFKDKILIDISKSGYQ